MDLFNLSSISSIIGIVGGILGFWSFIDNYLLGFSPKFKISNSIFFKYSVEKKNNYTRKYINAIFLKIDIPNTRNKIGRIDDFALRIYDPASTAPETYMFFARKIVGQTFSVESMLNNSNNIFSAISMLNKSDYSAVLELNPEDYSYPDVISENLITDLIYLSSKKEWHLIDTYNLHTLIRKDILDRDIIEYNLSCSRLSKKDADLVVGQPNISLYKGISGKYLPFYLMKPIYALKNKLYALLVLSKLLLDIGRILVSHIFYRYIILPTIQLKSKKLQSINFRFSRPDLINDTNKALNHMFTEFEIITKKINTKADDKAKINIQKGQNNEFIIIRGSVTVKCYKSGDGYITIHDKNNQISFRMELIVYIFGIKFAKNQSKIKLIPI